MFRVQFKALVSERNAAVPAVGVEPETAGTAALLPKRLNCTLMFPVRIHSEGAKTQRTE